MPVTAEQRKQLPRAEKELILYLFGLGEPDYPMSIRIEDLKSKLRANRMPMDVDKTIEALENSGHAKKVDDKVKLTPQGRKAALFLSS